jgi:hypothetical protein
VEIRVYPTAGRKNQFGRRITYLAVRAATYAVSAAARGGGTKEAIDFKIIALFSFRYV